MEVLLRHPHGFVKRHLSRLERGLVGAALAGLLYLWLLGLPAYPTPWVTVIAIVVFLVMLWSPAAAFFLAVGAALYPLYTISVYVAALFLAVALLGQRVFINHMGATLLVLSTPWLAQVHLAWVVPLLGGLARGKTAGAWMGGLAGLWALTLAGMTGAQPDWLFISGEPLAFNQLVVRFSQANVLETLKMILSPLAPDATRLLYVLLQVVVWVLAAAVTGGLAERSWPQHHRPFGNMLLAVFGGALLAIGHLWLAYWLQQYPGIILMNAGPRLALDALVAVLLVSVLEGLRYFVGEPHSIRQP
jgi:hypothetical protein